VKILLISANTETINMPTLPLGLGCVAETTRRAGHEIRLLDLMGVTDPGPAVREAIGEFVPDIIGVSVRNIDDQKMEGTRLLLDQVRGVISECRNLSGAPIVLGGAGYSIFPESALAYLEADMGIQGEGEAAFVTLLDRLEKKSALAGVPGLYLPGRGLQGDRTYAHDLDSFPLPATDLWGASYAENPDFWMPIQTRRGCSMDCSYCSTATIEGKVLRKRSPRAVVAWMREYAARGFHRFYFTDNTFNLPPSYARDLCRQIMAGDLEITWRCIVYPARLDAGLADDMARAGCREVSLGFESGSEQMLHVLNKRFKPDDVRRTAELLKQSGIRRTGFLLLGGPGETKETAEQSFAFVDSLDLEMLKISVGIRIYPETALADTAVQEGMLAPDDDLLTPRFYVQKGIEGWLRETVQDWLTRRSNWFM
jgi:radical SAM superfamily enzyme YgiQ (UPF0313 family)